MNGVIFNKNAEAAIIMGSISDFEIVKPAVKILRDFGVECEVRVISAHRAPEQLRDFMSELSGSRIKVIIGAAGKAAHLAGVIAGHTVLPVIALPIQTSMMGGLDSLLSMVQMPAGIPVASVGVNGGENAGLLAAQILSVGNADLSTRLKEHRARQLAKVKSDDTALQEQL